MAEFGDRVHVISGGDLYWSRGMARADRESSNWPADYRLWLNDDVVLTPNAVSELVQTSRCNSDAIVAGAVCDPRTGAATYGGLVHAGRHPLRLLLADPSGSPKTVDAFTGNVVLIPVGAAATVGEIDARYLHGGGDIEYGLRAARRGVPIVLSSRFVGSCRSQSDQRVRVRPQSGPAASLGCRARSAGAPAEYSIAPLPALRRDGLALLVGHRVWANPVSAADAMNPPVWNLAIALSGGAALLWLVRYLIVNIRRGWWTSASTLIVAAAAAVMVPLLIGDFAHGILSSTDAFGEPILVYDGWVSQLQRSFTLAFFVGAVAFAIWSVARGRTPHSWAAVVASCGVMLADIGNLAAGAKVTDPPLLALAAALLVAAWCRGPVGVGVGGVTVIVSVLGLSGLIGFIDPETAWKACRPDKCSPANALYQGLLVHENTMGLLVAPAIPFVVFGTRGRARSLAGRVPDGRGTRDGQQVRPVGSCRCDRGFSSACGYRPLALHLIAHGLAWDRRSGRRRQPCSLWVQESDQSFTARGELWRIARERIFDSPLWGHGSFGWRSIYNREGLFGDSSTYSPHNQVLDVAFTIGARRSAGADLRGDDARASQGVTSLRPRHPDQRLAWWLGTAVVVLWARLAQLDAGGIRDAGRHPA